MTYRKTGAAVWLLTAMLSGAAARAEEDAVGLALGKGLNDVLIQSGNIASTEIIGMDWRHAVAAAEWFDWADVDVVYLNLQLAHWRGEHQGGSERMNLLALAALWRWWLPEQWFAEASVGVARHSERIYESVELAGRNQFALDFAVGQSLDAAWEWSLRYRHYSNGYTADPNPGLDGAVLLLTRQF